MNKLGLNPKDFTKITSDDKSTTLHHKAGHTITVQHNVLSPKDSKMLQAISKSYQTASQAGESDSEKPKFDEGGKVPAPGTDTDVAERQSNLQQASKVEKTGTSQSQAATASSPSQMWDNVKNAWKDGGKVPRKKFAEGDPDIGGVKQVIPERLNEDNPLSSDMAAKREQYNDIVTGHNAGFFADPEDTSGVQATKQAQFGPDGQPPQKFDPKAWEQVNNERQKQKDDSATQVANEALNTAEYNRAAQDAGLPGKPTMDVPDNQNTNGAPQDSQPQTQAPDQSDQSQGQAQPIDQSQMPGAGGFNGAANEMANIEHKQLSQQISDRQAATQTYQDQFAQLNNERKAHIADVQAGYVDPEKYWDNHSKVAAGIGMILAGFNPTSRPNAAMEFLNHQMDRSMEAQKTNLSAKDNLLKANLQQFGNLHSATLMTQAMMNDTMAAQLHKAGLEAKNPLAKQAALGASGQFLQQAQQYQMQLAMRQTMMKLANGGGTPGTQEQAIAMMSAVNPEAAKVYREAYVPGVGMSKSLTPIPDQVKQQIVQTKSLNDLLTRAMQISKQPIPTNPVEYAKYSAAAKTVQQQLIGVIKQQQHDGVYKPSEAEFLTSQIGGSPASIFRAINSNPQLQELARIKQNEYHNLTDTYGLPRQTLNSTQQGQQGNRAQQALQWARQNPRDPRSKAILKKLGQ